MHSLSVAVVWVAVIAFVGFYQWLRYQRRVLIHRERLAALEKGIELPPVEQEVRRSAWTAQRILLLAGLTWISLGIGAITVLSALLAHPSQASEHIPGGIQWIGVAPIGIGLSHLVVYFVGAKREP